MNANGVARFAGHGAACPLRACCTTSPKGRSVTVSAHDRQLVAPASAPAATSSTTVAGRWSSAASLGWSPTTITVGCATEVCDATGCGRACGSARSTSNGLHNLGLALRDNA